MIGVRQCENEYINCVKRFACTFTKYPDLFALLDSLPEARRYFDRLPAYAQEHIAARAAGVNSYESLVDYAENVLRGDG